MARRFEPEVLPRVAPTACGNRETGVTSPLPPMFHSFRALVVSLTLALAAAGAPAFAQDSGELTEDARKQYAQALKAASGLVKDKQYTQAMASLDALLAQRPREPQARFLKGVVETDQGKRDAAMATFRALIEDYPELPEPYNNLAVLHAQKGEYESARLALETAVRTAPDWAVAHENLGDIYARLAAAEYDRATKLERDNKSAPVKLAAVRELLAPGGMAKPKP
jgi:tetratricopeptide (TPR) repeat protein